MSKSNTDLGIAIGADALFETKAEEKARKKRETAERKARMAEKKALKNGTSSATGSCADLASLDAKASKLDLSGKIELEGLNEEDLIKAEEELRRRKVMKQMQAAEARISTGVLHSRPTSRDIKIGGFSMGLNGQELIQDCTIELTVGRRYGLIGQNGCGKTNFLDCLAHREVPIPTQMDLYHLKEEEAPSDMLPIDCVVNYLKEEIERLNKQEEEIMETHGPEDERLEDIYERLEELGSTDFETDASKLLYGLGFNEKMINKKTKDMSGGWRMRVALARALFVQPTLLLLDEPTNHLDLEACVWLEEYLKNYKKCLVIVSHSQDFLNGVCTHTIWLTNKQLKYYTGNYDTFANTLAQENIIQEKKREQEQHDIKHLKQFIASCGTYANAVKQAQSKQKIIDKMIVAGLTPPVHKENTFHFKFPECAKLPPPVVPFNNVSFSYSGKKEDYLYSGMEFGIDCDSRIALVGPNGAGKSTLLKLLTGELTPTEGTVTRHPHLSIAKYHQHSVEVLDETVTPLEFFMREYPNTMKFVRDLEGWRAFLGRYGISGRMQAVKIGTLSEGQKSRLVFAMMCMSNPNMLLLDEPTNHLDMEAIDSLAKAIKAYDGGLVLVSHDFRLLSQVADEIWVCDKTVKPWKGGIGEYKKHLVKGMKKMKLL